jgi:hypothetical protein
MTRNQIAVQVYFFIGFFKTLYFHQVKYLMEKIQFLGKIDQLIIV